MLNERLNSLKEYIPGKSVKEIAQEFGLNEEEIIKLGSNENPIGASPKAIEAINNFINVDEKQLLKEISIYPDSLGQSLASAIKNKFPEIGSAEAVVGNGMDNVLECLARLLIEPGCQTLIHTPTFEYYEMVTRWMHSEPICVQTSKENNFEIDEERYLYQITPKVKMAFLCSPNNPTGNVLGWEFIEKVIQKASSTGTFVFLDEAYVEYSGKAYIGKVQKYNNLIIGRTFSKVYGLAGLRIGWGVIPQSLLADYRKVQTPFNVNKISLHASMEALKDSEFLERAVKTNQEEKEYLVQNFNKLGLKTFETSANFIPILAGQKFSNKASELCDYLLQNGIIVRNASRFRDAPEDLVRITIGTRDQNAKILELFSQR